MSAEDEVAQAAADFSCSICLGAAKEPVVTKCGHLYCWSCLDSWLQRAEQQCPVCKGQTLRDRPGDIIPLYGKGAGAGAKPSPNLPRAAHTTRPAANREAPRSAARWPPINLGERGGWIGGFFVCVPVWASLWTTMLLVAAFAVAYRFVPWRAWLGWDAPARGGAEAAPPPPPQRRHNDGPDITLIATLIALFSLLVWATDTIAYS